MTASRTVGIVQPTYLPWLPFFERMARSDVFILLDDVQFSKNSPHNRNAILGADGPVRLTVPVRAAGRFGSPINQIEVDSRLPWQRKHWRTIEQHYRRAPYFERYAGELQALITAPVTTLAGIAMPVIAFLRRELGIGTPCVLSSELAVAGVRNEKLVNLCKAVGGTHFLVKPGTESYHPADDFEPHGISLRLFTYTPIRYPQQQAGFVPGLSALDFLLNCGPGTFVDALHTERAALAAR